MGFSGDIGAVYGAETHNILTFIGDGFERRRAGDLRVAVVGLNAYFSERHWPPDPVTAPADWTRRFREGDGRYFTSARKLVAEVAAAIGPAVGGSPRSEGLSYDFPRTVYATNAVKTWVRAGKHSSSVTSKMLADGEGIWRSELALMAEHGVLPHLIVVLAEPFWRIACRTFRAPPPGLRVHEHVSTGSAGFERSTCRHFVNRYVVQGEGGPQPLVLLRLYHPSAPKKRDRDGLPRGTVRWLAAQPDFRAVVGLPWCRLLDLHQQSAGFGVGIAGASSSGPPVG